MKPIAIYPGNFDPFHVGHAEVVRRAVLSGKFERVVIMVTMIRESWFSAEEKVEMIKSYDFPWEEVDVQIYEAMNEKRSFENKVILRGIRNEQDIQFEKFVRSEITRETGCSDFFYIECLDENWQISSSGIRNAATEIDLLFLKNTVTPTVLTFLLEKYLGAKLYIVTGKPGSGKSTLLDLLTEKENVGIIKIDEVNREFRNILIEYFGVDDLFDLVRDNEEKVVELIGDKIVKRLSEILFSMKRKYSVILVECAYAIKYEFQNLLGKRFVYVDCNDVISRNKMRGTHYLLKFDKDISDCKSVKIFCKKENLYLIVFDSESMFDEEYRKNFYEKII